MGSIEFCKFNLAFEGDLRGGQVPSKSVKVIENGDFRVFDSFQAGQIIVFKSGGWRKIFRYAFSGMLQMRRLFLWMKMQ